MEWTFAGFVTTLTVLLVLDHAIATNCNAMAGVFLCLFCSQLLVLPSAVLRRVLSSAHPSTLLAGVSAIL